MTTNLVKPFSDLTCALSLKSIRVTQRICDAESNRIIQTVYSEPTDIRQMVWPKC